MMIRLKGASAIKPSTETNIVAPDRPTVNDRE